MISVIGKGWCGLRSCAHEMNQRASQSGLASESPTTPARAIATSASLDLALPKQVIAHAGDQDEHDDGFPVGLRTWFLVARCMSQPGVSPTNDGMGRETDRSGNSSRTATGRSAQPISPARPAR